MKIVTALLLTVLTLTLTVSSATAQTLDLAALAQAPADASIPTFTLPGTAVESTPIVLVFGIRLSILTVDAGQYGRIQVLCFNDLAWRCRRQPAGTQVLVIGVIFGDELGNELLAQKVFVGGGR